VKWVNIYEGIEVQGGASPPFPVSCQMVLCQALTVPQASATDIVVGKLGSGVFLSHCLWTRVARLGLLVVPGDQKRLQHFRLHLLQVEMVNIHIIVKFH